MANYRAAPLVAVRRAWGAARNCIGQNFAFNEEKVLLTTLLRRYRFELVDPMESHADPAIVLRISPGLRVIARRRAPAATAPRPLAPASARQVPRAVPALPADAVAPASASIVDEERREEATTPPPAPTPEPTKFGIIDTVVLAASVSFFAMVGVAARHLLRGGR